MHKIKSGVLRLHIIMQKIKRMSAKASPKSLISKSVPKAFSVSSLVPLVIIAAAVVISLFLMNSKSKKSKKSITEVEVVPVKVETPVIIEPVVEEIVPEKIVDITDLRDDPHTSFPSMLAEVGDADAELASSFTYENLQDSMLTSARNAREAVKSRASWSRFGNRSTPEIWENHMSEMKKEIEASGQTIEQFMENTLAPIPEQMAAFWKDSSNHQLVEVKSVFPEIVSKEAMSEAPSLTRDAMQRIGSNREIASIRLKEVLDARKRAKSLKLKIPELSLDQKKDVEFWSNDSLTAGTARALSTM